MIEAFIGLKILGAICAGAIIPVLGMAGLLIFFATDDTPKGVGARRLFGFLGGLRSERPADGERESSEQGEPGVE